jgi:predicted CopG family antitoxin
MDKNKDGKVSMEEFINQYVEGEIKLKERMNDVIKELAERRRQMDEFEARLSEAIVLSPLLIYIIRKQNN